MFGSWPGWATLVEVIRWRFWSQIAAVEVADVGVLEPLPASVGKDSS